jgi:hypothetical protein
MLVCLLHLDEQGVNGDITRVEEIMSIMDTYEHEEEVRGYVISA